MTRYVVYRADRAGCMYDVAHTDDPVIALGRLHLERQLNLSMAYGVWDEEYPEAGDCENRLEEME